MSGWDEDGWHPSTSPVKGCLIALAMSLPFWIFLILVIVGAVRGGA